MIGNNEVFFCDDYPRVPSSDIIRIHNRNMKYVLLCSAAPADLVSCSNSFD